MIKAEKPPRIESEKGLEHPAPLKPCPYCGHVLDLNARKQLKTAVFSTGCREDWVVCCPACDAIGPWACTRKLAIENWNRRDLPREPRGRRTLRHFTGVRRPKDEQSNPDLCLKTRLFKN